LLSTPTTDGALLRTKPRSSSWSKREASLAAQILVFTEPFRIFAEVGHAARDGVQRGQSLLAEEPGAHEATIRGQHQKLVPCSPLSEFLNQTGSTFDFTYDVENTYLKCSFFEEDIDIMVNLLLDLALREKNLFEVCLW
jgi:hypothetical protein